MLGGHDVLHQEVGRLIDVGVVLRKNRWKFRFQSFVPIHILNMVFDELSVDCGCSWIYNLFCLFNSTQLLTE